MQKGGRCPCAAAWAWVGMQGLPDSTFLDSCSAHPWCMTARVIGAGEMSSARPQASLTCIPHAEDDRAPGGWACGHVLLADLCHQVALKGVVLTCMHGGACKAGRSIQPLLHVNLATQQLCCCSSACACGCLGHEPILALLQSIPLRVCSLGVWKWKLAIVRLAYRGVAPGEFRQPMSVPGRGSRYQSQYAVECMTYLSLFGCHMKQVQRDY